MESIETRPCGCCGGARSKEALDVTGGVNEPCHGNTFGVNNHGSHVIARPAIYFIYWDSYFTTTPAAVTSMNQFGTDMVSNYYVDGLSQYGIGRGSFAGSSVIDMTKYPTPNSSKPGVAFAESDVQSQLTKWMDDGVV